MAVRNIKTSIQLDGEKAFNSSMKEINSNLRALKSEMSAVESQFRNSGNSSEALRAKHEKLNEIYEQQKIKVAALKQALAEATAKYGENSPQVDKLRSSLANAEVEMGKTEDALAALDSELDEVGPSATDAANAFDTLKGITDGLMNALQECAQAAIDFEASMAGVSRTTGLKGQDLEDFGNTIKDLSTEIPVTTGELADVAKTAGQLGISGAENVTSFTKTVSQLAVAAEMTSDETATMLAQFSNITGSKDYERMASTIAVLGDSTATTAKKTLEMAQNISAAGTNAGMSSSDIIAIAASVGSLGIEAAAGGTAMSRLITKIDMAVASGEGLGDWADAANMSASQFATLWGNDAAQALDAVITGLHGAAEEGANLNLLLDGLGITNQREVAAVKGLITNGELLTDTLQTGRQAWAENTGLAEKSATMFQTTEAKMTMAENAANNLKIAVGDALAPALGDLAEVGTDALKEITGFVEKNPEIVQAFTAITGGVAATTAAIAAYKAAMAAAAALSISFSTLGIGAAIGAGIFAIVDTVKEVNEAGYLGEGHTLEEYAQNVENCKERVAKLAEEERIMAENGSDLTGIQNELTTATIAVTHAEEELAAATEAAAQAQQEQAQQAAGDGSSMDEFAMKVQELTFEMNELKAAYEEAYLAAHESLSKQFGLFQDVSGVALTSTQDMIAGMNSQRDYWNTYTQNMQILNALTDESIGLNEGLVSACSDGSDTAVQQAASLVAGYQEALSQGVDAAAAYIENVNTAYEGVQSALDSAAEAIAKAQTDFDAKAADIEARAQELAANCDVSAEMSTSATNSVNAFNASAQALEGLCASTGASLGYAFANAFNAAASTAQASVSFSGGGADGSHASGLGYVPFDGYRAILHQGEMVIPNTIATALRNAGAGQFSSADGQAVGMAAPMGAQAVVIENRITLEGSLRELGAAIQPYVEAETKRRGMTMIS